MMELQDADMAQKPSLDERGMEHDNIVASGSSNLFGWSNKAWGIALILIGSVLNSVDSIMYDIAGDAGVGSNALTLYASSAALFGALLLDTYYYHVGYTTHGVHWFVFIDIWRVKQRNKFLNIPNFSFWFLIFCVSSYFYFIFLLIAYVFADDLGDALAIFDMYPILIPLFSLCIREPTGHSWKHRYFLCFLLIFFGLVLLTQPGFIFGYDSDTDPTNQTIAVFMALFASIFSATLVIANTLLMTLSDKESLAITQADTVSQFDKEELTPLTSQSQVNNSDHSSGGGGGGSIKSSTNSGNNSGISGGGGNSGLDDDTYQTIYSSGIEDDSDKNIFTSSDEYIVLNEKALITLAIEYSSLINICLCILFAPLSYINGSWFWDEFALFYSDLSVKGMLYSIAGPLIWMFDYYAYTFGIFKLRNATLAGILDISDVFFSFLLSYVWLGEDASVYDITGSLCIITTIFISVYPWKKHKIIPHWW